VEQISGSPALKSAQIEPVEALCSTTDFEDILYFFNEPRQCIRKISGGSGAQDILKISFSFVTREIEQVEFLMLGDLKVLKTCVF
jgi:hypothetical protein